jgi:subtilisin family serine protease
MAHLDPQLAASISTAAAHEVFDVDIFLKSEPAREAQLELLAAEGSATNVTVESVIEHATRAQMGMLAFLEDRNAEASTADGAGIPAEITGTHWATNSVAARVSAAVLEELAGRDDVLGIYAAHYASIKDLMSDGPKEGEAAETVPPVNDHLPAASTKSIAWGVSKIKAPMLWANGIDGNGVVVAVIDSGVNYRHDDLKARMWVSQDPRLPNHGFDFGNNDDDPFDQDGHGTACAGIVAGDGSSGRFTGVAPGARIMALRVNGSEREFWAAMEFAMKQRAHVLSMSMSWASVLNPNQTGWRRMCESLLAVGILHANSIGNAGLMAGVLPAPRNIATPGNCPPPHLNTSMSVRAGVSSAVACGATTSADALDPFSGKGPAEWNAAPYTDYPYEPGLVKPDLCAPGPGTETCNWRFGVDDGAKPYLSFGGTSAATPHVAGCMALLAHATLRDGNTPDPARILEALEESAVRIAGQIQPKENNFGAGRVDVYGAYLYGRNKGWWT